MLSSNEIKRIKALQQKKFRDEQGLFVVEGEKMVAEVLDSSFEVVDVFRVEEIGREAMERISSLSSPSPVLAVVRQPKYLHQAQMPSKGLYLCLDSIRDPGNMGTIIRSAEWFGVEAIFAANDSVDIFNPKVVQATMGALFRVDFHYVDLPEFCRKAKIAGADIYGTFLDGENMYGKDLSNGLDKPSFIITGNESRGISEAVEEHVTERLYIPPYPADEPGSESLNAAVATALTLAEFRRRTL
ncbi:MAG: RNA methyltransferase [Bacteroidales bacterium]|nr:RNA methyltransferase [Bacteroidales bacterium]